MPGKNLILADEFASEYDESVLKNNWNGPETLYNSVKGLLKPSSSILDLGIGTGESSKRFQEAGHSITGLDGSKNMLLECKKKNVGEKLIHHDLEKFPYPLQDKNFDAIISNGVFHLVYPLREVFSEAKRLLKPSNIFVFTYENSDDRSDSIEIQPGIWKRETESGVQTYKYSDNLIQMYLAENDFELVKRTRFLAFTNPQIQKNIYFIAIVAQLNQV